MLRAVFVSDLHLTRLSDSRGQFFLRWLRNHHGQGPHAITHLFLVGDIFDLWLAGHRYFIDQYRPLIDEIRRLHDEGVEIHYFEGNHDLHLAVYWQKELGVKVHSGPARFELGPWRVRVEHGDEADPSDRGYRFLRWLLRTSLLTWLIHHLPGPAVQTLGEKASRSSRRYTSQIKTISRERAIAMLRRHAQDVATREPFDILINGHVHVGDDFRFKEGGKSRRAINLGSWFEEPFQFLELTEDGADLKPVS